MHTLILLQLEVAQVWTYKGTEGAEEGPFELQHLRVWLSQEHLYPHLEVSTI